jgi:hypothetical protein
LITWENFLFLLLLSDDKKNKKIKRMKRE